MCIFIERKENKNKLRILLGESMGGAMVLRLDRMKPTYWDGGVLVAPMCKVCVPTSLYTFTSISYFVYKYTLNTPLLYYSTLYTSVRINTCTRPF